MTLPYTNDKNPVYKCDTCGQTVTESYEADLMNRILHRKNNHKEFAHYYYESGRKFSRVGQAEGPAQ